MRGICTIKITPQSIGYYWKHTFCYDTEPLLNSQNQRVSFLLKDNKTNNELRLNFTLYTFTNSQDSIYSPSNSMNNDSRNPTNIIFSSILYSIKNATNSFHSQLLQFTPQNMIQSDVKLSPIELMPYTPPSINKNSCLPLEFQNRILEESKKQQGSKDLQVIL